jgi:hypothetical protein
MTDQIVELGVGGIFALMVIDRMVGFLRKNRNGVLEESVKTLSRSVEKQSVAITDLCRQMAILLDRNARS